MPVMPRAEWDSIQQYLEYIRHLAAYTLFARQLVTGNKVLEIGCGTSYGANELLNYAFSIVAIDMSEENILYSQAKYKRNGLLFMIADGITLPFKAHIFDVVVSFQVIEHIEPKKVMHYLSEVKMVLKLGGIFILSTPNSRLRLLPFQKPWNPEHIKEYKCEELKKLLSEVFEEVQVYGLYGSDEIQAIECNRVKQSPFKVYIVHPFYRALNYLLPLPIFIRLKKIKQHFSTRQMCYKQMPQETFMGKFSVDDFRIDPSCPKDSLDLYGICTKVKD